MTTCLYVENLVMVGNLIALMEIQEIYQKPEMSRKNLIKENWLLLTWHLGLFQYLVVASCMHEITVRYTVRYNIGNHNQKMSGNFTAKLAHRSVIWTATTMCHPRCSGRQRLRRRAMMWQRQQIPRTRHHLTLQTKTKKLKKQWKLDSLCEL